MSATGKGAAENAAASTQDDAGMEGYTAVDTAAHLDKLAAEAEAAADGAEAKVGKQREHLAAAEQAAQDLRAEATAAREAADQASEV